MAIAALGFSAFQTALVATTVVSAGATIAGTIAAKQAADQAADTARSVADYNARLDASEAKQLAMDTTANIAAMRRDAAVYMSRQESTYVANGIRANTGSALAVRAATAGRLELRAQQEYTNSEAKQERLASQGQAGVAYGEAEANRYHLEGAAAVMGGASKLASLGYGAVKGGVFGSPGGNYSTDLSTELADSYGH